MTPFTEHCILVCPEPEGAFCESIDSNLNQFVLSELTSLPSVMSQLCDSSRTFHAHVYLINLC